MVSAMAFATLLQHPRSPVTSWPLSPIARRGVMGVAMGLTATALIYSPFGQRSGAHMNPALTLAFLRLKKIAPPDAAGYLVAQFLGAAAGVLIALSALRGLPADLSVNYVATLPGPDGAGVATAAEAAISFVLMLTVLIVSNSPRFARFTGVCAGCLVAIYVTVESPISGMSMNPARTLAPAVLTHTLGTLWVYIVGPLVGMFAAAELFIRFRGAHAVRCAKLHHPAHRPCIFRCTFMETDA
jgi:aquaporin Z